MKLSTMMAAGIFILLAAGGPVSGQEGYQGELASNSFGVIDTMQEVTLSGTIKYVRLVGERSRIQLLVKNEQGGVQEWSLEGPAEGAYMRSDKVDTPYRQHDNITVVIHPNANDPTAGEIVSIVDAAE